MSGVALFATLSVAQALENAPQISRVLIQNRTACVGCYFARFCTLQQVATAYGVGWPEFLQALESAAAESNSFEGEQDDPAI